MDAAYAVSSLAQVHLKSGEPSLAEEQARHAIQLLGDSEDVYVLQEVGNAQLVLGRSLLEQEKLEEAEEIFELAERTFKQVSLSSQLAAAWIAQGDLAARRRRSPGARSSTGVRPRRSRTSGSKGGGEHRCAAD